MSQNVRGLLAYLFGWIGGLVVLLAYKDNEPQTKLNACQSIVISATSMFASIILGFIPYVGSLAGSIIGVLMTVCMVIGMVKAYKNEPCEFPVITDVTKKLFAKYL